jgi:hypothetical protein
MLFSRLCNLARSNASARRVPRQMLLSFKSSTLLRKLNLSSGRLRRLVKRANKSVKNEAWDQTCVEFRPEYCHDYSALCVIREQKTAFAKMKMFLNREDRDVTVADLEERRERDSERREKGVRKRERERARVRNMGNMGCKEVQRNVLRVYGQHWPNDMYVCGTWREDVIVCVVASAHENGHREIFQRESLWAIACAET